MTKKRRNQILNRPSKRQKECERLVKKAMKMPIVKEVMNYGQKRGNN
jgi:hypothetical protein